MRIAVTGATGLIGRAVVAKLLERGDEVVAFSRDPERARETLPAGAETAGWDLDDRDGLARDLSGVGAVVNLVGEPVLGKRWNAKVMEEIRESRVRALRAVVRAMGRSERPPEVLVSASAVGYYGPRDLPEVTEETPPGDDFLAGVCVDWEEAARSAEALGTRVVLLRTGIVLSANGGALRKMLPPFKWFVGGKTGNGRQGFPWVHIDDVVEIVSFALETPDLSGPVNVTAPRPVTNREFTKALGRTIHRPSWLPVPRIALRLALGRAAAILVKGQMAVPRRLLDAGYWFRFPDLEGALEDLLG